MGWCGLDWSGSGLGPVVGACECGDEPSGSIKCWEVDAQEVASQVVLSST
jgi:hypothetical protein